MSNLYAVQPELDADFPKPRRMWTDVQSGLQVPKDPDKNLQWRAELLAAADKDTDLQVDLYTASSQSVLFWVNAFAFTLRIMETKNGATQQAENKHLPYVTWDIQDTHLLRIEHAITGGEELLTDKSRDMGATWNHIAVLTHRLLFRDDESHLVISRKEDSVDNLTGLPKNYPFGNVADPGTLFGKIDYILSRLPEWMVPRLMRKSMSIVNLDTRSRIDGESSNATAGTGDRRASVFLDEMSKMAEGESIKRSTRAVTACRLVCSTPNGAGTAYSKWRLSGTIPVFILPWWNHPEKGLGRYTKQDELGRWKIRSPWYDAECAVRSPKEIAIEVDMDHVESGDTFFEANVIEQQKKLYARPPRRKMTIGFKKGVADDGIIDLIQRWQVAKVETTPSGPWRLWCELHKGRPDQNKTYTLACDISKGQGASNSVISVLCNETREKVAEYADANTPPHALARLAIAACLWFGGKGKRPLLIWENNGDPGFDFNNQIVHVYKYPYVYFDRAVGTLSQKVGKRHGWRSTPEKKAVGLGLLRRAYAHNRFINHSEEALSECLMYVHYDGGGIGPAGLVDESDSTRKAHGDRVIADMLLIIGLGEFPALKDAVVGTPQRTFGYRLKQFKERHKESRSKRTFNFAGAV